MKKNIENHITLLVESRAIAAIEYEGVINEIVDDLYNQTKNFVSNINVNDYPIVYISDNIPVKVCIVCAISVSLNGLFLVNIV